jgi:ketosteroid isomerase-like protein
MSEENVEVVRRWFDALNTEDFDAALAMLHPDIQFFPPGGQNPYRGADSVRRWMEPDAFRDQAVTPVEIVVAGDRTILARQHVTAQGATSGIPVDIHSWSVWSFDDAGLVTRLELYLDHEEDKAREAAGLVDEAAGA